jgi:hypothetical protein
MENPEKQLAVEWLIEQINPYGVSVHNDLFEQAKAMEEDGRHASYLYGHKVGFTKAKVKEDQFVLNMPFKIIPLISEVVKKVSKSKWEETTIKGYIIKDAKGVEYFFYEDGEGVLKYDGWSADLKTTKED